MKKEIKINCYDAKDFIEDQQGGDRMAIDNFLNKLEYEKPIDNIYVYNLLCALRNLNEVVTAMEMNEIPFNAEIDDSYRSLMGLFLKLCEKNKGEEMNKEEIMEKSLIVGNVLGKFGGNMCDSWDYDRDFIKFAKWAIELFEQSEDHYFSEFMYKLVDTLVRKRNSFIIYARDASIENGITPSADFIIKLYNKNYK